MEQVGGLPLITLNGDARSRGLQHGAALSTKIHRMIEVYRGFFGMSDAEVFEIAAHFRSVIRSFNPDYGVEIEGIAEASDTDPLWIYALNARSEFLSFVPATECTVLHFKGTPYLGQNWDWEESLEPLITLVRIERNDGPSILMMTEPGIIGKIGLNEAGLGVCFNFLNIDRPTNGLPTHILLRAILEAGSLDDARETIMRAGPGRSSNMLVADRQGDRFDIEFAATEQFEVPDKSAVMAHTNHYLDRDMFALPHILENSTLRYDRVRTLEAEAQSLDRETMERMLSDTANPGNAICQSYRAREPLGEMGTVCTLTMDLAAGDMAIRRGNNPADGLEHIGLSGARVAAD
ncbi:MAG: C45 family peptidase [Parvibaculaceae bacterium]